MRRWIPALALSAMWLAASACGWRPFGYKGDEASKYWADYDYVYQANAPVAYYPETYIMFDVASDGSVTGQTQTIFWAQFTGTLSGDNLSLQMAYENSYCQSADDSHAEFAGQITGPRLVGQFSVQSCTWQDFTFDGKLVGGRKWTPADAESTP
jgi:hypothetical protein